MENQKREDVIRQIAASILRIKTLEARNSDSLDFHDVAVWQVHEALTRAWAAGVLWAREIDQKVGK